ncbi:fatty-acid amide hydrolase 2-B-like [Nomia melanderi]|uniref:fatty-acid amide hydrolase 2-B-like n=1 Tax=Nomia melanderi TaxID=2448451 RepID=UPI00130402A0|nr:fatty-acid amide hydrolase 2-B-like [Nomia melanderi]XP_031826809.1 fatty-acid amide hydrolase 2-B-like [Nomia melanderi]XP_031826810.1 fatty-acid amide hydrolase 2-B-like [Nomia melanderi]XP_031826811.1 fatty-acid amide hydrolase 2-B-like [Nomia melanderi]
MWLPIFITILLRIERFILRPFFMLLRFGKRRRIPPIKNSLLKSSATSLAKRIRDQEISSQEVVEAFIERIKEVNPYVNAVIEDRFEAAIKEAKICDSKLRSGEVVPSTLEKEKPLYGVPVTIKESLSLKGMSYTGGNLSLKGRKATENSVAVQMVLDAGAIPLCVTNTPELCSSITSTNFLYGTTVTPYDTTKSSGGSSSGEGALIGSGASALGFGSDLVGSIRVPSLFNGVFGHKPSASLVPTVGHYPHCTDPFFLQLLTIGPMSRYVDDIYTGLKILTSKSGVPLRLDEPVNLQDIRVYYVQDIKFFMNLLETSGEIQEVIEKATQYLSGTCASVEQLSQEWVSNTFLLLLCFFGSATLPEGCDKPFDSEQQHSFSLMYLLALLGLSRNTLGLVFLRRFVEKKGMITEEQTKQALKYKEELHERLTKLLGDNGVLIMPTFPEVSNYPEILFFKIDCSCYTAYANILRLPATHVPLGLNKSGLPIGFQVLAGPNQDRLCLAVAKEFERKFGGWIPPN